MDSISIPDTPAGHQVREWLDCLDGGELDRVRDFAARYYSAAALDRLDAEARAALDLVHHRNTGGLVPERVQCKRSSETELWLLARARLTGELLRLHVAVEPQAPHPITGIHVDFVPPADAPYDAILSEAELVAELGEFVDLLASGDCFSGAVLLARGEEVLLECAHGLARREPDVPNRPDTRFNYASVGKMFTAVAIAQLGRTMSVGLGWHISRRVDFDIVTRSGGTAGSHSFIGLDKARQTAVVLLANSVFDIDDIGFHLLDEPGMWKRFA